MTDATRPDVAVTREPRIATRSRLVELFEAAVDRDLREREAIIATALAEDASLGETLRALLATHERTATLDVFGRTGIPTGELPARGSAVGPWIVGDELGHGGMGVVYRAVHETTGETGALKVLRDGRLATAGAYARFLLEQHALRRLDHPGIARFLDAGLAADGAPYLVTECVDGIALDAWCRRAEAGTPERLRLLQSVADAVAHAHQRGVLHRDLKPSNILVTHDGHAKLVDFGIARFVAGVDADDEGIVTLTQPLGPALTPEYAPPEVLDGAPPAPTFDVYSFGIVAHELLLGFRPLDRVADTLALRRVHAGVAAVVARALSPLPRRRWPDGGALAAAWRDAMTATRHASHAETRARRAPAMATLVATCAVAGAAWFAHALPPRSVPMRDDALPADVAALVATGRASAADSALRRLGTAAARRLLLALRHEHGPWLGLDPRRDLALARQVAAESSPDDSATRHLAARVAGIAGDTAFARTLLADVPASPLAMVLDAPHDTARFTRWVAAAREDDLLATALPYATRRGDDRSVLAIARGLVADERSAAARAIGATVLAARAVLVGDTIGAARWDALALTADRHAILEIALRVAVQQAPVSGDSVATIARVLADATRTGDELVVPRAALEYVRAALALRIGAMGRVDSLVATPWGATGSWGETLRTATRASLAAARGDSALARATLDTMTLPLAAPPHPDVASLVRERALRAALDTAPQRRAARLATLDRVRPLDAVVLPMLPAAAVSATGATRR